MGPPSKPLGRGGPSHRLFMGKALETGEILVPEDGPVSWTAHADLADAAVIALTEEGRLDGKTAPLTGSAALDMAAIATIASEFTGRPITRVTVTDDAYRAGMVARGVPQAVVEIAMGMFLASRAREFAAVDKSLEGLLGRPPISMRDVLTTRLSKFS